MLYELISMMVLNSLKMPEIVLIFIFRVIHYQALIQEYPGGLCPI